MTWRQAWTEFYARHLLIELHAEPAALDQAIAATQRELTGGYHRRVRDQLRVSRSGREPWAQTWDRLRPQRLRTHRHVQRLGFELAQTARTMIADAGADDDPRARDQLLAASRHAVTELADRREVSDLDFDRGAG